MRHRARALPRDRPRSLGGARGLRAFAGARELTPGEPRHAPAPAARAAAARSPRGAAARLLLRGLAAFPDRSGLALGAALGRTWVRLGFPRTRAARVNLRIAFPEWREAEREDVLRESFANLGRSAVELAWLGRRDPRALAARVRVEGREHLEAARAQAPGGGVIVLTAHFGSWELIAAVLVALGFPLAVVHRTRDDLGLDEALLERRLEGGATFLPRGVAAFGALRALRSGSLLALPFDQNARSEPRAFIPFFGRLASTSLAVARLALVSGAPVLPGFIHRDRSDPAQHVAHFHPALELDASGSAEALVENARRMTRAIEREIRTAPELWAWAHRRWRTQPAGEPRPLYERPRAKD
ncbi:MAG: lysophospholipid acyltransferase family protein [Myxococcota bacterium]